MGSQAGDLATEVTVKEVIGETLINVERIEEEVARVKRRLLELLELAGGADL